MCGYILCAKDLKVYEKNAYPYYLTLKELDEVKAERFPNANRELERFYPEYPAHIHIDILEEYTGNGVCSKLMQALFEVLKEEKVPGICVLVDTNNKRAVRFYEKTCQAGFFNLRQDQVFLKHKQYHHLQYLLSQNKQYLS